VIGTRYIITCTGPKGWLVHRFVRCLSDDHVMRKAAEIEGVQYIRDADGRTVWQAGGAV